MLDIKTIGKILQEAGKIEQYQQILELLEKNLEMQKRINELEMENHELQEKLKIKESLVYVNQAYWTQLDNRRDGPFCSRCWDTKKLLIRMPACQNPEYHICPECRNAYETGRSL